MSNLAAFRTYTLNVPKTLWHLNAEPKARKQFLRLHARYHRRDYPMVYIDESGFLTDSLRTHL